MRATSACRRSIASALTPSRRLITSPTKPTLLPRPAVPSPFGSQLQTPASRRLGSTFTVEPEPPLQPVPRYVEIESPHPLTQDPRIMLKPGNLFHPFDQSPAPSLQERARYIKEHAYCPHPDHATENHTHINFTCPDCGIPTYCSEKHWQDDYENHLLVCDAMREVNEDEHDLRSGRFFPEFEYPGVQLDEALINFTNWDTYLYTRDFPAINDERSLRQVTKLLTYPTTIASVVHELSPYNLRNGLTKEGLRSITALRYNLHPPRTGAGQTIASLRLQSPPIRLFILGARAESSLPREVWHQLCNMFPQALFHLVFIGPESMKNRGDPIPERDATNPFGAVIERVDHHMKISTFTDYYHTLHESGYFKPYDPYFDMFVCFHPGFGHPGSAPEWEKTLPLLLETKMPILATGYTEEDLSRDVKWIHDKCAGEFDVLMEPQENRFKSLRWDINDDDPSDLSQGNWGLWMFRGKRYEAVQKEGGLA